MNAQEIFRAWRRRTGLSQVDLGARIGIDGSLISRWESGEREINRAQVLALGTACRIDAVQVDVVLIGLGFMPTNGGDPAVLGLAKLLGDPFITEAARAEVRAVVLMLVALAGELPALGASVELVIDGHRILASPVAGDRPAR